MNDQITQTAELDLDNWLAGGERTTHNVNLFARYDLLAEIDTLEAQRVKVETTPEGDEALGGNKNPNASIDEQIEELEARIYASKKVFRVSALTKEEIDDIRELVLNECSEDIDKAAALGRQEAKKTAKRMEISVPADINALVKIGAKEFTDKLISRETTLRRIAQATKTQNSAGDWVPLSLEQIRTLYAKLGETQISLLADAAYQAENTAPKVTVPKS